MLEMRYSFWFVYLFSFCDCSDVFHEGSKVSFRPNYEADLFGYALAFDETGLIVGAPNATMPGSSARTGAVFTCPLQNLETRNVTCTPLKDVKTKDFVQGMMFGASMAVGPTGKMVICAPRWSYTTTGYDREGKETTFTFLQGACYLRMKRFETLLKPMNDKKNHQMFDIDDARTEYRDYHLNKNSSSIKYYWLAQAGMAVKVTQDTIIFGAPGLLAWTGGVVQYKYDPDKRKIQYSPKPTYNPYFTHDVRPDEYFGYSVEAAVFEDGGSILYVAGGPRGKQGFGMVLVFEPAVSEMAPLNILAKLGGPQLGSYFGASLRCMDVNADGRTDLLVGAPYYVKQFPKDDFYDQGAVFVYLNKEKTTGFVFESAGRLMGSEANGAKFGYSIAELGDIDGDGYNDVAVSAPWEENGAGAVYVYGGDRFGFKQEYIQRIVASEAQGFGMGLTKGHDVDRNNCNDLVVGAHKSNSAYIYRCIPTVRVQGTINVPEALNLPQNTTNFTAQFCVNVLPLGVHPMVVMTELKATVTIDPRGKRAAIAGDSVYKVSATTSSANCEEKTIEMKPGADLSRPITIIFDLEPVDRMQDNPTHFLTDAGRVTKDSILHSTMDIQLVKECGKDLICTPWLVMTLEPMDDPYIPGAEGRLGAVVRVLNAEEPAFGIHVNLSLPSLPKRVPATCNLKELNLTCELPSPFNQNQTAVWEVEFEYTTDMSEAGVTIISADIDDAVLNRVISENATQYLEINIELMTDIAATGKALPNATVAVSREVLNEGRNISFVHYYQVSNAGPSDCPDLSATLLIPKQVSLRQEIAGCEESWDIDSLVLLCSWSVKAKQSLPIELSLRYDVAANGKFLETNITSNITSTLLLDKQNMTVSITTSLILNPAPELWIAIVVAVILGFLLLAGLSYLFYEGSMRRCDNYRTLALISHASKILLHILNRIRNYLDWQIPQEQAGFVKDKGTREQILNVRQLVEKAYEHNTTVIMYFIDYSKAFDCVNWNWLWKRGFFSRPRREAYNDLDQEDHQVAEPGASSLSHQEPRAAEDCNESTVFNSSNDPSTSNIPRLTFRGPSNDGNKTPEPSCSSPVTLSESTALYTTLRRQLETDPDIAD